MRHLFKVLFWAVVFIGLAGVTFVSPVKAEESKVMVFLKKALNPEKVKVVESNNGGYVAWFSAEVEYARRHKIKVELADHCDSACTLFFTLPPEQLCLARGVQFGFHQASAAFAFNADHGRRISKQVTEDMLVRYPSWVRRWIAANGGLRKKIITMPYEYASQYIKTCT